MEVTNIPAGPSDAASEAFLSSAEASAKAALSKSAVIDIPHVAAWRDTYKAFGAKPKKTINSLEKVGELHDIQASFQGRLGVECVPRDRYAITADSWRKVRTGVDMQRYWRASRIESFC